MMVYVVVIFVGRYNLCIGLAHTFVQSMLWAWTYVSTNYVIRLDIHVSSLKLGDWANDV